MPTSYCYGKNDAQQPFYTETPVLAARIAEFFRAWWLRAADDLRTALEADSALETEIDPKLAVLPDLFLCTDPPGLCGMAARVLGTLAPLKRIPVLVYSGTALHTAITPYSEDQWRWQRAFMRYHMKEPADEPSSSNEAEGNEDQYGVTNSDNFLPTDPAMLL